MHLFKIDKKHKKQKKQPDRLMNYLIHIIDILYISYDITNKSLHKRKLTYTIEKYYFIITPLRGEIDVIFLWSYS